MDTPEEIVRLLALLVRMNCATQAEAIRELSRAGFGPSRIAELLGTTAGTVGVTLAKTRESSRKKGA